MDSYLLVMGVVFCCLLVLAGRSRGSQLTQRRVPLLARPEVPLSRKLCRMPHPTGICVERRLPQATCRLPSTKRADQNDITRQTSTRGHMARYRPFARRAYTSGAAMSNITPRRYLSGLEVAPGHPRAVQHKTSAPRGPKA